MRQLNAVLSGYGKMGKEVEHILKRRNHNIVAKLDNKQDWKDFSNLNVKVDVVIDFSMPSVALDVFSTCFNMGIPLVTGTTGWYDKKEDVFRMVSDSKAAFFYAPNFSIGVNLFFYVNKKLAGLMNTLDGYHVSVSETHHIHKQDAPSGTAIQVANDIVEEMKSLSGWTLEKNKPHKLPIHSVREGEVTGIHEIRWESNADEIILKHTAKNRSGFALGAVMAAEYIQGKKGVFTMNDMLNLQTL